MRYARLQDNVVMEVVDLPDDVLIEEVFHPDLGFRSVPPEVEQGWLFDGSSYGPPQPVIPTKPELKDYAAAKHVEIERGGYQWGSHVIMTDPESQLKLATERLAVVTGDRADGEAWITAEGPVALTNAQISEVATAVRAWVKGLYSVRSEVIARIESGLITAAADIDAAFQANLAVQ